MSFRRSSPWVIFPVLLIGLFLPVAGGTRPDRSATGVGGRWDIELTGGWAVIGPADLNAFSVYDQKWHEQVREGGFAYNRTQIGASYRYTVEKKGDFPMLDGSWKGGIRLVRRLSPRLAASLGFQYLDRQESATVEREYHVTFTNPDSVQFVTDETTAYRYAPHELSLKTHAPEFGIEWTFWMSSSLRGRSFLRGGPVWASCRVLRVRNYENSSYRFSWDTTNDLRGKGIGFRGEAGLCWQWDVSRKWGVFLEGAYAFEKIGRIAGSEEWKTYYRDGDAGQAELDQTYTVDGRWRMKWVRSASASGEFYQGFPVIGDESLPAFRLDLSGFQIRLGVVFHL